MPEADREAFEAAERLVREARERAERAAREDLPPNGWAAPGSQPPPNGFPDLGALLAFAEGLRGQLPPELAARLAEALRELLLALRAVLDYAIERLDPEPPETRKVEDIPIT